MAVSSLPEALSSATKDNAIIKDFLTVWPIIESILEAFSRAISVPTFVFLNEAFVFSSSSETLSPFCFQMLRSADTANLCTGEGPIRLEEGNSTNHEITMCHAGMLNSRREVETGFGTLTILFGARKSNEPEGVRRRDQLLQMVRSRDPLLAGQLKRAAAQSIKGGDLTDDALIDAVADVIQRVIDATTGFRSATMNMAHELSLMLLNLGLVTGETEELLASYRPAPQSAELVDRILSLQSLVSRQCRLGLFIVRNFLSHSSEVKYEEVVKPKFKLVNLDELLREVIYLHHFPAVEKGLVFDYSVTELPPVHGDGNELRRLFHNVLNNAIKYSYHSVPHAHRVIKIRGKVPYDPGFKRRRFSVTVDNYGLGFTKEESRNVLRPGFRGRQAIAEVPIGSGIGLSEVNKIMKLHGGEIRMHSKELYSNEEGRITYLTTVDLIFPYSSERIRR